MDQDIWHYQIQYMQRLQKLQESLKNRKVVSEEPMQAFQNSMMQVGAKFWNNVWQNPNHMLDAQKRFFDNLNTPASSQAQSSYSKYFKSDLWNSTPYFQWVRDIYIKTAEWAIETIEEEALGFSGEDKDKLMFLTRQWIESMNPRNFPATNPEIWRETLETKGENFLKGMDNLITDIEHGSLSMTDNTAFQVGKNIAATKGSVIFKNKMMELIQYAPTTDMVAKTPVVIIPPWINKYYILDLTPETSMIQWMVNQGHTVFCISWANPDESFRDVGFKDYMHDGALKAIEVANAICETESAHAVGYCIGGTLLAMTQAWLEGNNKKSQTPSPIKSATFITTLLDFESAGDLKIFIDKDQVQTIKKIITDRGIMDGKAMAMTFSLLRASDLIWSFVINNYMLGRTPMPFDLLYWNSDSTNLPAAMHGDYLQSFYLNNDLAKADYILDGVKLDLTAITTPAYFISTRDDHIAPWMATQSGANIYGNGKNVTFVLGGSGHVAGVVNPPTKNKYGFEVMGDNSKKYDGSWWTHWQKWVSTQNNNETITARKSLGSKAYKILDAAPGQYVLQKA